MAAPARDDYKLEMQNELMGETPRPENYSFLYTCRVDEKCSGRKFHRQELEKHVLDSHMPKYPGLLMLDLEADGLVWGLPAGYWRVSSHSRSEMLEGLEWRINYFTENAPWWGLSKALVEKTVSESREFGIKMNQPVWAEWQSKVELATAEVNPLFHIAKHTILKRMEENSDLKKTKTGFWHYDPKTTINDKVLHCDLGISPLVFNKLMDGFNG